MPGDRLSGRDRGTFDLLADPGNRDLDQDGARRDLLDDPGVKDLTHDAATVDARALGRYLSEMVPGEVVLSLPPDRSGGFFLPRRRL